MKIAVMQPYLFPYLGYFQLVNAVDKFIILDTVHYINRGWINRNRILLNGKEHLFTIPLHRASQNRLIKDIALSPDGGWRRKLLRTINLGYARSPYFATVFEMIVHILQLSETHISGLACRSLLAINEYLGIRTTVVPTSTRYENDALKAEKKILDICRKEGAQCYINPVGGVDLYDTEMFRKHDITLQFIKMHPVKYQQRSDCFVPDLSIIDVLMNNSAAEVGTMLTQYELVQGAGA
jgi:hypothetical protein